MNVEYTGMGKKMLSVQRDSSSENIDVLGLRFEIRKLESVVEHTFAPRGSSGLFALSFHLMEHFLHNLESRGRLSFMDAGRLSI